MVFDHAQFMIESLKHRLLRGISGEIHDETTATRAVQMTQTYGRSNVARSQTGHNARAGYNMRLGTT